MDSSKLTQKVTNQKDNEMFDDRKTIGGLPLRRNRLIKACPEVDDDDKR
jgi:hypothetical protein